MKSATLFRSGLGLVLAVLFACEKPAVLLSVRIAGDERKSPLENPGTATVLSDGGVLTQPGSPVDLLRLEAFNADLNELERSTATNDFVVMDGGVAFGQLPVTAG